MVPSSNWSGRQPLKLEMLSSNLTGITTSEFSKECDDSPLFVRQVHVRANREIIRKRKSIIEHVFGTVKRDLGISYLLLRGREKVTGEISLAFTAFNMKRAINILGVEQMVQLLAV